MAAANQEMSGDSTEQESTKHFSLSRLKDLYEQHGRWKGAKPYRRELEKLGELYYQKAQQGCIEEGAGWTYYVKAHSIVNLCLANTEATSLDHTELQRKRYEIEEAFYKMTQMTHPLSFDQVNEAAQRRKRKLEAARQQIRKEINKLDSLIPKLQQEGKILSRKNRETLGKFNKAAANFSKFCTTKLQGVLEDIFKASENALGEPPCQYAVIAVGSLAREESSAYSDLEYMFAIEKDEHREYFHRLAVDSYFRFNNLGETPLKYMGISELCDESGSYWFNIQCRSGLKIDGLQRQAGNIPTGNGRHDGFPLTFTREETEKIHGHSNDNEDVLACQKLIHGSPELFSDIRQRWKDLDGETPVSRKKQQIDELCVALLKYDFLPVFKVDGKFTRQAAAKTDIFRFPTLLVFYLKNILGIDTCIPWEVVDFLQTNHGFNDINSLCLKFLLSSAIYIRSSAYLHYQSQRELIHFNNNDKFYTLPEKLGFVLACLLSPLKLNFTDCLLRKDISKFLTLPPIKVTSVDEAIACFTRSPDARAAINGIQKAVSRDSMFEPEKLLKQIWGEESEWSMYTRIVLLGIANIYFINDKKEQSNNLLRFLLEKERAEISSSDSKDFCNWKMLSEVSALLALTSSSLGKRELALEHAQESYDCLKGFSANHSQPRLSALLRLGASKEVIGQFRAGLQDMQEAANGLEELRKTCPEHEYDDVITVLCIAYTKLMGSLNGCYAEYERAVKIGEHSLSIIRSMLVKKPGLEAPNELIIRLGLGGVYIQLGKYDKAKENLNKALLGCCDTKTKSFILLSLGKLYERQGYIPTALHHFELALETIPPGNIEARFRGLIKFTECLFTACDLDRALSYLEQALTLYQNMESTPRFDAELYFYLGRVWVEKGDNRKCLDYLTKAEAACTILSIELPNHPIITRVASLRSQLDFSSLAVSDLSPSNIDIK